MLHKLFFSRKYYPLVFVFISRFETAKKRYQILIKKTLLAKISSMLQAYSVYNIISLPVSYQQYLGPIYASDCANLSGFFLLFKKVNSALELYSKAAHTYFLAFPFHVS